MGRYLLLKQDDGTYTTNPHQMDECFQKAWQKIYDGNVTNATSTLTNYLAKYGKHLLLSVILHDLIYILWYISGSTFCVLHSTIPTTTD